jgi:hypothetical protein
MVSNVPDRGYPGALGRGLLSGGHGPAHKRKLQSQILTTSAGGASVMAPSECRVWHDILLRGF